jgi:hypothetical protein
MGWPIAKKMTHDDRLFVTASVIAATGFLRGGEFLSSPRSSRPVLRGEQVNLSFEGGKAAVTVSIAAPKARWWLKNEQAVCFSIPDHPFIDPVRWLQSYRSLSSIPLDEDGPAFVRSNGDTLSRNWMVARSASLMTITGIAVRDQLGNPVKVLASSWRAGGVQSARDAGLSDALIMSLGRWTSIAWTAYSFNSVSSLSEASRSMWAAAFAARPMERDDGVVAGTSPLAGAFAPDTVNDLKIQ